MSSSRLGGSFGSLSWLCGTESQRQTGHSDSPCGCVQGPITDSDTFRWGEHTYRISKVDGIVKDEVTGTRFFSEVFVLR